MNTYVTPRVFGGKEAAVWLCVDRIEGKTVVLLDDQEKTVCLDTAAYEALVGRAPAESDVLAAEVAEGRVLTAAYDGAETDRRKTAARARLNRLFGKS